MDVNASNDTNGAINQTLGLKKQNLKNQVGFSLQKKNAEVQIHVNKNLMENRGLDNNKGNRVNIFA